MSFAIGFLVFIIITLMFFFAFNFGKGEAKINIATESANQEANIILLNYLRTPVENKTIAELIGEYYYNDSLKEIITNETLPILQKIVPEIRPANIDQGYEPAWAIFIISEKGNKKLEIKQKDAYGIWNFVSNATVPIPGKTDERMNITLAKNWKEQ